MNSTSLDINVSETLANKTLIITTILVSWPGLRALGWVVDTAQAVLGFVSAGPAATGAAIATARTPEWAPFDSAFQAFSIGWKSTVDSQYLGRSDE